jgi:hypothetical protein
VAEQCVFMHSENVSLPVIDHVGVVVVVVVVGSVAIVLTIVEWFDRVFWRQPS